MDTIPLSTLSEPRSAFLGNVVYFVRMRGTDFVKIGTTTGPNIKLRLAALQTASPMKLDLLLLVKGGVALERSLHMRFLNLQRNGEWFEITNELVKFFEEHGVEIRAKKPGKTFIRYKCKCSNGFTRIYRLGTKGVDEKVYCAKCASSQHLSEHVCQARNQYAR